jgi:hypothetical protein
MSRAQEVRNTRRERLVTFLEQPPVTELAKESQELLNAILNEFESQSLEEQFQERILNCLLFLVISEDESQWKLCRTNLYPSKTADESPWVALGKYSDDAVTLVYNYLKDQAGYVLEYNTYSSSSYSWDKDYVPSFTRLTINLQN